jgi:PAS domain S-box-containing protein
MPEPSATPTPDPKPVPLEQRLQRRAAELRAIVYGADLGIIALTADGTITFANPACEPLLGIAPEALSGRKLHQLLVREDQPLVIPMLQKLGNGEIPRFQMECRWQPAGVDPIWGNLTVTVLRRADGAPRLFLAMIENINRRKQIEAELNEVKRRLARSRERARLRLAQDLHDGPIQDLYAVQYQLGAIDRAEIPDLAARTVNEASALVGTVVNRLRRIMGELRPPALAPFGLEAALRSYAEAFQQRYPDLSLHLELAVDGKSLPEHVRLSLYRITQEMLNNVVQHAAARNVLLRFEIGREDLLLEIQDDGRGFEVPTRWIDLARHDHLGLVGATERAEDIDGQLTIHSAPGQGTIVRVIAPRPKGEHDE